MSDNWKTIGFGRLLINYSSINLRSQQYGWPCVCLILWIITEHITQNSQLLDTVCCEPEKQMRGYQLLVLLSTDNQHWSSIKQPHNFYNYKTENISHYAKRKSPHTFSLKWSIILLGVVKTSSPDCKTGNSPLQKKW